MLSFTPGSDRKSKGKPKEDPLQNQPLTPKGIKQAKQFAKGVRRFLRYNKDLLSEEKCSSIQGLHDDFLGMVEDPSRLRKEFEEKAEHISKTCKKAVPEFKSSLLRENIEVLFVAVVIAMGIRAYFIQQFKIPTGSMQPTLNGIIAYPAPENADELDDYRAADDYQKPNYVQCLIEKVWLGRTHVEWRVKEDGDRVGLSKRSFYSTPKLILFPRTYLATENGHRYSAAGTLERVRELLCKDIMKPDHSEGDLLARGYLETGDMLIVNKMIYHWRRPKRGEVFVFNTRNITGIGMPDPRYGSQHYIKRLCGLPGDHIRIEQPNLIVNGEPAKESAIRRVVAAEGLYNGYLRRQFGRNEFHLGPKQYLALGDNSKSSADSRDWGHVPQENIVGKAVFVFYPFGKHFGSIK